MSGVDDPMDQPAVAPHAVVIGALQERAMRQAQSLRFNRERGHAGLVLFWRRQLIDTLAATEHYLGLSMRHSIQRTVQILMREGR